MVDELLSPNTPDTCFRVITSTTRPRRELESSDAYNFLSSADFMSALEMKKLVEHDVFNNHHYGLMASDLELALTRARESGGIAVAVLTPPGVQAAMKTLDQLGAHSKSVFVDCDRDLSICRLVSRYIHESRALKERAAPEDELQRLSDRTSVRLDQVATVEDRWRSALSWDIVLDNSGMKSPGAVANELMAQVSNGPGASPEKKLAMQQAASMSPSR